MSAATNRQRCMSYHSMKTATSFLTPDVSPDLGGVEGCAGGAACSLTYRGGIWGSGGFRDRKPSEDGGSSGSGGF